MAIKWAIDVSYYDALIATNQYKALDWKRAREEGGLSLAIIKSSEGANIKDPAFDMQWKAAAGILPRMAYHFFRCNQNPVAQAQKCWTTVNSAGFDPAKDFIILDFESKDGKTGIECLSAARAWLEEMEKNGIKPLLWTYPAFWKAIGGETASWALKYPLGLSQWPKDIWILSFSPSLFTAPRLDKLKTDILNGILKPVILKPWTSPALWQFTARVDTKAVPGHPAVKKVLDYNAIYMDLTGPTPILLPEILGQYRCTVVSLNVFSGAGDSFPQVGQLTQSQTTNVVEFQTINGVQWARIDSPAGWCVFASLTLIGPNPIPLPTPLPEILGQYRCTVSSLIVLGEPGDTFPQVGQLTQNQITNVVEIRTTNALQWARLDAPAGWCVFASLTLIGANPPPPPLLPEILGLYRFTGVTLKVFGGPGETFPQVSQLIHNQTTNIVEFLTNNGEQWARLNAPAGWCKLASVEYIGTNPPPPLPPLPEILGLYRFSGISLKVFAGPGDTFPQVSQLIHDQTVNVVEFRTTSAVQWARIDAPAGWCRLSSLIKL